MSGWTNRLALSLQIPKRIYFCVMCLWAWACRSWRVHVESVLFCLDEDHKDQTWVARIAQQGLWAAPHLVLNIPAISFLLVIVLFLLLLLPLFYFRKESHYVTLGGFQSRAILLPYSPSWTLKPSSIKQFSDLCQLIWKSIFKVFDHKHFFWQK